MIIKHKNMKDVCFEVYFQLYDNDSWILQGRWVNQGFVKSWYLPVKEETIIVQSSDFKDWLRVKNPNDKCLRYSEWTAA